MNCIILEDDPNSQKLIEAFVRKTDFLTLMASFSDAISAINYFNNTLHDEVDLIFLDIEMPEMSGFDFIKNIKYTPQVIIISAKEKYAVDAFEFDITDYILKPIIYARFYKAVDKAYNNLLKKQHKQSTHNMLYIRNRSSFIQFHYEDILWFEALENYIILNTSKEKLTIHYTLKSILEKLPNDVFIRIHRSFIVNKNHIHSMEDNRVMIKTNNATKAIPIGKVYKENLLKNLNIIS